MRDRGSRALTKRNAGSVAPGKHLKRVRNIGVAEDAPFLFGLPENSSNRPYRVATTGSMLVPVPRSPGGVF